MQSPIPFNPCSNGEYCPRPDSPADRRADALFQQILEDKHKRTGMSRRQFAQSSCGMAAALMVINKVYGCGDDRTMGTGRPAGGSATGASGNGSSGADAGVAGDGSSGGAGTGASGSGSGSGADSEDADGARAGSGGTAGAPKPSRPTDAGVDEPGFDITEDMLEDEELACGELLNADQFILDIQTHTQSPLREPWSDRNLPTSAESYINTIFAGSETSVAVLSGIPSVRNLALPNLAARKLFQEVVEQAGGPRLIHHANLSPNRGASELEYMEEVLQDHQPTAWKVYPHSGGWRLDSQEVGLPFVEQARSLGLPLIAAHRGLADNGDYDAPSSPIDLANAARQYSDVDFICYHSGYESRTDEDHPFDPAETNPVGVDRLIKAVLDNDLGTNANVYAELGTTWNSVMRSPGEAAHVLGKLLLYVGEDRVVWGTDCVFHGSPQAQISALRMFEIPESMQMEYGYPALTGGLKAKIFGLNAAPIYRVDPEARRCAIAEDSFAYLRKSYLHDRRSVPVPTEQRPGPRTRREFLRFRRFEEHFDLG